MRNSEEIFRPIPFVSTLQTSSACYYPLLCKDCIFLPFREKSTHLFLFVYSFFSINDPSRGFAVMLIIALGFIISLFASIPVPTSFFQYLIGVEAFQASGGLYFRHMDYVAPFGMFLGSFLYWIAGRSLVVYMLICLPLIAGIVLSFNQAINNAEILKQRSYIPAWLFALLFALHYEFLFVQPELFALAALIFALNRILVSTKKVNENYLSLSTGIAIGIATLFHFPSFTFLLFSILVLLLQVGISFRAIGLHLFGVLLPAGFVYVYCFYKSDFSNFLAIGKGYFTLDAVGESVSQSIWIPIGLVTALSILGLLRSLFFIKLLNAQLRANWVMIFWSISAFLSLWIKPQNSAQDLLFFLPPAAYFLSIEIDYSKRSFFAEAKVLGLLLLVGTSFYLSKDSDGQSMERNTLTPHPEKSLMSMQSDLEVFKTHKRSGPFLNQTLGVKALNHKNNPAGLITLYEQFEGNLPDIVIDSTGLFAEMLLKIPKFGREYVQTNTHQWEKKQED